jgi:hypothetical protein
MSLSSGESPCFFCQTEASCSKAAAQDEGMRRPLMEDPHIWIAGTRQLDRYSLVGLQGICEVMADVPLHLTAHTSVFPPLCLVCFVL